jgi:hypothetical protein
MKKLIIIFSLIFVSCETKTETQVQAEQIQKEAREQMNSLPVIPDRINTGENTDTLCPH